MSEFERAPCVVAPVRLLVLVLSFCSSAVLAQPEAPPRSFLNNAQGRWLVATGTWERNPLDPLPPNVSTVTLSCERDKKICFEATASVSNNLLTVGSRSFEIERWTRTEIVTKLDERFCMRRQLRVDLIAELVTESIDRVYNPEILGKAGSPTQKATQEWAKQDCQQQRAAQPVRVVLKLTDPPGWTP